MALRLEFPGYDLGRARRYGRIRRAAMLAGMATGLAGDAAFARTGHAARVRARIERVTRQPEVTDAVHIAVTLAEQWAIGLPQRLATGYALERKFGMTRQPLRSWLADDVKGLALGMALGAPVGAGALSIVRRRPDDWHLVLPTIAAPLQVLAGTLAPVLLMPIFNTLTPIDDGPLRARIDDLAQRAGIEVEGAYTIDLSRQTERANALFTGIGKTRRVVFGDTLLRSFEDDEIAGVVAHELGHQAYGDVWRMTVASIAATYVGAFALRAMLPRLAAATGAERWDTSAAMPVWGLALSGLNLVGGPVFATWSRSIERRTDAYAIALTGDPAAYARGMERLVRQNLSDPYPPRWATLLFASHPPPGERIERALAAARTARPSHERTLR